MTESADDYLPAGRPEVPEMCPQPDRNCRYDSERLELRQALRDITRAIDKQGAQIAALREDLARGSEKFRRSEETQHDLGTVKLALDREKAERLASEKAIHADLAAINQSLSVINEGQKQIARIVYGACGFVLLSVLGALLALVITKGVG